MTGFQISDIPALFAPVPETLEDSARLQDVRLAAARLAAEILKSVPKSPAQTHAINKLIESVQWAERATIRVPDIADRREERVALFNSIAEGPTTDRDLEQLAAFLGVELATDEDDEPDAGDGEKGGGDS